MIRKIYFLKERQRFVNCVKKATAEVNCGT